MSQGKELTYEQKQAIVQVKKYMDFEKAQGKEASTLNPAQRTAKALNFTLSTVKSVLSTANKNKGLVPNPEKKPRGHGISKVSDYEITIVRQMIQDAHYRCELVTLPKLLGWLEEQKISVTYSYLKVLCYDMVFLLVKLVIVVL